MDAVREHGRCAHRENAVGWALYALGLDEEHALRAHLQTCAECRATVREAEQVAALMGHAVPQHEPPSALRARLMVAINDTPRAPRPLSLDLARQKRQRRGRGLLAAAAAVVVVLGGVTTVLGVQVSQLNHQQQAQAAGDAMVQSIVADPTAKRAVLTNSAGKPTAMLITSASGSVVVPLGLTPNGRNQQYVAWGLHDAAGPSALASFDVPADSVRPIVVDVPASARGLARFAISLEPGRVMPQKPTDVIASGSA